MEPKEAEPTSAEALQQQPGQDGDASPEGEEEAELEAVAQHGWDEQQQREQGAEEALREAGPQGLRSLSAQVLHPSASARFGKV